jgi:hypothetical protein
VNEVRIPPPASSLGFESIAFDFLSYIARVEAGDYF